MVAVWPMLRRLIGLVGAVSLFWIAIAVDLVPFTGPASGWPAPDLLYCVAACLVLRRPGVAPAPLVFAAGLLGDLLSGGAVGTGALALLLASELLRSRALALSRRGLLVEWLEVAAVGVIPVLLPAALHWVTLADVPGQGPLGLRWLSTIFCYPFVVALVRVGHDRRLRDADGRAKSVA